MKTFLLAAALATTAIIRPAMAQAAAAAQPLGGNPVPGICLLSHEAVFANAKVGQAATARLRELAQTSSATH